MKKRMILITESDMKKLKSIVGFAGVFATRDRENLQLLEEELDRADVLRADEIPENVVTMNSQVRVRDSETGCVMVYTLVFPQDADASKNRISILAPIGTALLGHRIGDVIECNVPAGVKRLRVEEVLYQPEAAGVTI
jgi:regulator of nucleoside diphosphate kinase